jgi:hypothetical protein
VALLQIVGGDKLIIPLLLVELHMNPFKAGIFSVTSFCGPYALRKYGISYRELGVLAERG